MQLVKLLDHGGIADNLTGSTHYECFREMVLLLKEKGRVSEVDNAVDALMEREKLRSTALGDCVAIPHARIAIRGGSDMLKGVALCLGFHSVGIELASPDETKVHIFFLMLTGVSSQSAHLETLARIAKLVKLTDFCKRALSSDGTPIYRILEEEELRLK